MEALQRLHNRGSISTGYDIDNSLKLEPANSERLYFTPSSAGNRKTWTVSLWFKRTDDGYSMMFGTADTYVYLDNGGGGMHIRLDQSGLSGSTYLYTTAKYRDTSAWYHFVMAVDTTQSTASNRAKFYVNGVQVTDFTTENYPTQNIDTDWNFTNAHYIGGWTGSAYDSAGYMAEIHSVDGQQLAPTEFGEFDEDSGIWKPKAYTGSYGTNGFYLDFENASDLGDDVSGNNKNFVLSNITSADQATDTPTNNFCTLNTLSALGIVTYTEGATVGTLGGTGDEPGEGSMMFSKGKWYFECQAYGTTDSDAMFGLGKVNEWGLSSINPGGDANSFGFHQLGRVYYNSNSNTATGWTGFGTSDKVMVAIDHDNGFAYFGVNGTWGNSGDPTSGATGTGGFDFYSNTSIASGDDVVFAFRIHYRTYNSSYYNFGGYTIMSVSSAASDANGYGTFEYAPPSGYYALCTKNLAEYG